MIKPFRIKDYCADRGIRKPGAKKSKLSKKPKIHNIQGVPYERSKIAVVGR